LLFFRDEDDDDYLYGTSTGSQNQPKAESQPTANSGEGQFTMSGFPLDGLVVPTFPVVSHASMKTELLTHFARASPSIPPVSCDQQSLHASGHGEILV
jgi:hypothetical protein